MFLNSKYKQKLLKYKLIFNNNLQTIQHKCKAQHNKK